MEIFINELSLHGQYPSQDTFTQAIKQFVEVFACVQDKVKSNEIFKDEFFADREALINETFKQSFGRITNPQLKEAFRGIIFNKLNPKNWQTERLHSNDVFYLSNKCAVQDDVINDTSVAEIAERKLQRPHKRFLLINFNESVFKGSNCFDVTKEGEKNAIELDCIETKEALIKWLDLPIISVNALLRDSKRFVRTKFVQQGAVVFQEKSTSYYWYLDNLHKNEFEVFNSNKEHIGVANLEGIIQPNSKIDGRVVNF